jgi:hypothetical protein
MVSFRVVPRLVALLTFVVVLFVATVSASAATGSIQVGTTAKLVAGGVAVDVPLTVSLTCDEGFEVGIVEASVVQAHGGTLTSGSGQETFTCNGAPQTVTLRAFAGTRPFHGGRALVNADLLQCIDFDGSFLCELTGITTSEEIRISGN